MWIDHLHRGSNKKIFQSCLNSNGFNFFMRAIQGHSVGNKVDLSLLVWREKLSTIGVSTFMTSVLLLICILLSNQHWLPEEGIQKEGRQAVFFTAVNRMTEPQKDEPYDVTKPRKVPYKTKWNVYQDAVYWINLKNAQEKGLAFWQTRSNAVILHDSVPADGLGKVVSTRTEEILYQSSTRRLPSACNQQGNLWRTRERWNLK